MAEEVGFGGNNRPKLDLAHEEAKKILLCAAEAEGTETLNEWEETFVTDALASIDRYGNRWDITEKRGNAIETIKGKLEKEGFI